MQKKKQVIMLPTDKASNILLYPKEFKINYSKVPCFGFEEQMLAQHLYILSDEEIKEDDWFIECIDNGSVNAPHYSINKMINPKYSIEEETYSAIGINGDEHTCGYHNTKKIIATTNSELLEHSLTREINGFSGHIPLPRISQDFIEAYIKSYNEGNVIKDVMVEYKEIVDEVGRDKLSSGGTIGRYSVKKNLKIRSDNTIIINRVKEKKYTADQMKEFAIACCCVSQVYGDRKSALDIVNNAFDKNYPE